jgi:hypothetical protein
MTVYLIDVETRKNDRDEILGPFSTFEKALEAMLEYLGMTKEEAEKYDEFDSKVLNGEFFSEEKTVTIYKREIQ